ncbi:SMR family transporter [Paraburkholderia xenovorans]|uniref:SMR family transporter n=1 Tax=Paraburkholderia xenovorans TaxID=36873 RepID=UPI0038BD92CA
MLSQQLAWLVLAASVIAEALGTAGLKLSSGFTRLIPSILTVVMLHDRRVADGACHQTA